MDQEIKCQMGEETEVCENILGWKISRKLESVKRF